MIFSLISIFLLAVYTTCVTAVCTPATHLAGAQQVVTAYNLQGIGESATAFSTVPWGDQCVITMYVLPFPLLKFPKHWPSHLRIRPFHTHALGRLMPVSGQRSQRPPSSTILLQRLFKLCIRCRNSSAVLQRYG